MPTSKKYYYYQGKKLFITQSSKVTSVCFKGAQGGLSFLDDKYHAGLLSYNKSEQVALYKLPEQKTRQLFEDQDSDLAIYPICAYETKNLKNYPPLIFNSRYFVRFIEGYSRTKVEGLVERYHSAIIKKIEGKANLYLLQYRGVDKHFLDTVNNVYENNKEVVLHTHPDFVNGMKQEAPPNLFSNQEPVLKQLNVIDTWSFISGGTLPRTPIKVAILDEGIQDAHNDLATVAHRTDFYSEYDLPFDNSNFHGTAIAGIINAINDQTFITGVAYETTLIDVRISVSDDDGNRYSSNTKVIDGIQAAISKGARVINISWSHPFSQTIVDKIKEALALNIVVCCAAGNYASGESTGVIFPAIMAGSTAVIAVAACDEHNNLINYNNTDKFGSRRGPAVTIMAPGRNIATLTTNQGHLLNFKGTSASVAFISGIAALLLSIRPASTAQEIKDMLRNNAGTNTVADAMSAMTVAAT